MTDNVAITGSGKLQCKKIIHLNAPGNDKKLWKERILQCLQLAEANKLTSIALPAVGTGMFLNLKPLYNYFVRVLFSYYIVFYSMIHNCKL